jgi:hypothetical protein
MKFCKQCGVELPDEANFCKSCGAKVSTSETLSTSEAPEAAKQEEKKQGCLSYIFLYAKVLFIAIGSVFLLVIIMELFSDDKPSTPETEQNQPVKSQSDTTTDNVIPKGDESIFPKAEELDRTDIIEPDEEEGFQSNDDMTPQERAVFMESLIERSEAELEEELAKGDAADMEKVKDIREGIANARKVLNELKQ